MNDEATREAMDRIAKSSKFDIDARMAELAGRPGRRDFTEVLRIDAERHWSLFEDACARLAALEAQIAAAKAGCGQVIGFKGQRCGEPGVRCHDCQTKATP